MASGVSFEKKKQVALVVKTEAPEGATPAVVPSGTRDHSVTASREDPLIGALRGDGPRPLDSAELRAALIEQARADRSGADRAKGAARTELLRSAADGFLAAGEVELAKETLRALAAVPEDSSAVEARAELAILEQQPAQAAQLFETLESRIRASLPAGDREAALAEVSLKIAVAHEAAAQQSTARGDYAGAIEHIEAALARAPSEQLAATAVALVYAERGSLRVQREKIAALSAELEAARTDYEVALKTTTQSTPRTGSGDASELEARIVRAENALAEARALYAKSKSDVLRLARGGLDPAREKNAWLAGEMFAGELLEREVELADALALHEAAFKTLSAHGGTPEQKILLLQRISSEQLLAGRTGDASLSAAKANGLLEQVKSPEQRAFLRVQNKMLRAEVALCFGERGKAEQLLQEAMRAGGDSPLGERAAMRLADLYACNKEELLSARTLLAKLARSKDPELAARAELLSATIELDHGDARKAITTLAALEEKYPNTTAAQASRNLEVLAELRDAKGKLRTDFEAADLGEAMKVALVKSGEQEPFAKLMYAGLGMAAVALTAEITLPLLAAGAAAGLLTGRGITALGKAGAIAGAYATGVSNVNASAVAMESLMLGADVVSMFGVGLAGNVARSAARFALSQGARSVAGYVPALGGAAGTAFGIAGRALGTAIPLAAEGLAQTGTSALLRSLITGEPLRFDPKEAALSILMCGHFAAARKLGAGEAVAARFGSQKMGAMAGVLTDSTIAVAADYFTRFGLAMFGDRALDPGRLDQHLWSNVVMTGAMMAGSTHRRSPLGEAVARMDAAATKNFAEARGRMYEPTDFGGPMPATAGATGRLLRVREPGQAVPRGTMHAEALVNPRATSAHEVLEVEAALKPGEPVTVYVNGSESAETMQLLAKRAADDGRVITLLDVESKQQRTIAPGSRPGIAVVEDAALAKQIGEVELRVKTTIEKLPEAIAGVRYPIVELSAGTAVRARAVNAIAERVANMGAFLELRVQGELVARVDGERVTLGKLGGGEEQAAACALLRDVLWTGRKTRVEITGAGAFGGTGPKISAFGEARPYLVEVYVNQTAKALGAKSASDPVVADLRRTYDAAMHEAGSSKVENADAFRGKNLGDVWSSAAGELAALAQQRPVLMRSVVSKVAAHSGESFNQNALDLMRIAKGQLEPAAEALRWIDTTFGTHGSVTVSGSVVRVAHDAFVANQGPAQHEQRSLDRVLDSFKGVQGRQFMLTAPRTDSTGGLRKSSTPDLQLTEISDRRVIRLLAFDSKSFDARFLDKKAPEIAKGMKQVEDAVKASSLADARGVVQIELYGAASPRVQAALLARLQEMVKDLKPNNVAFEVVFSERVRHILKPETGWTPTKSTNLRADMGW